MYTKNEIIIEINDMAKYDEISKIINKYCKLQIEESENLNTTRKNDDNKYKIAIYKFKRGYCADNLIKDLKMLCKYITFKNPDSKKVLEYKGTLKIKFDNIKYLQPDTLKKLDNLKKLKMEIGYCKGTKPFTRPMATTQHFEPEYYELIYIFSESIENLLDLKLIVENKVLEIDSNLKVEFRLFE